jgi:hypothetical protein
MHENERVRMSSAHPPAQQIKPVAVGGPIDPRFLEAARSNQGVPEDPHNYICHWPPQAQQNKLLVVGGVIDSRIRDGARPNQERANPPRRIVGAWWSIVGPRTSKETLEGQRKLFRKAKEPKMHNQAL